MTTISASWTIGIKLNSFSYTSPVVVGAGVTISNTMNPDGVYTGPGSTTYFAIRNIGTIIGASTASGTGVYLAPGGSVTNMVSGSITGGDAGVEISDDGGTVVNDGIITGTGISGVGIRLTAGGSVSNAASASVTGTYAGIRIGSASAAAAGTVVNHGSIAGTGSFATGVYLFVGGSVTNAASASIIGRIGVLTGLGVATVVNDGSITGTGTGAAGVGLDLGGLVTNGTSASITGVAAGVGMGGGGTVVNHGAIVATDRDGVYLNGGGSVTNTASASITGGDDGVGIVLGVGTVVNDGTIAGVGTNGRGVELQGSVTNAAAGSITGVGSGAYFLGGTVLINYGIIAGTGTSGIGIHLSAAGSLTNAGTIIGSGGTAVAFAGFSNNLLVVDPGAVFSGAIDAGANSSNALELASGSVTGTVIGQGRFFTNLDSVTVDGGASWDVTDSVLLDAGGLANDGQIVLDPSVLVVASLTGTGSITIDAGSTLMIAGTVSTGETIVFAGKGGVLDLGDTAAMAGTIAGYGSGDAINNGPMTVANNGAIVATNGYGVILGTGGMVTNAASASIPGSYTGVVIAGGVGTVVNDGSIAGTARYGVDLRSGGSVTNAASASISGSLFGVEIRAGGTLTNAGTIIGSGGTAVSVGGTGSNLVVLDPGFGFSGVVSGSESASNTLELASGASAGSLSGLGSQYTNFSQTTVDIGAAWTLTGTNIVSAGQTMTNSGSLKLLGAVLTIDGNLVNDGAISDDPSSLTAAYIGGFGTINIGSNSTLTATSTVSAGQTIAFTGTNAVLNILQSVDFAGTITGQGPTDQVNISCFAAGTRILTTSGEVPVEDLRIGDRVATVLGSRFAPIVWLGLRHIDCPRHPHPDDVWPVSIKAGAIADGVPHRDLWLSPEHAVLFRDDAAEVLVPVRCLLNGTTIVQVPVPSITYWHVELAGHDAIVAEGLAAETYLDTGNRADFANGGDAMNVHPTFADAAWRARACAPQLRHGEALEALRRRLGIRAAGCDEVQRGWPGLPGRAGQ